MCGIAGKLWFDPARPADVGTVAAMTAALAHRGPDDRGLVQDGALALGHRRLTVVDLSPRGRQPMASRDGDLLLVANGEIYNHRELRRTLGLDWDWTSDCDVEVILAAYRRWWDREGPHFVARLAGMFAFALWDRRARRLLLARDRVGQKPLVYAPHADGLTFASELAALRHEPRLDRTPDWQALSDYLSFRVVPHPRTAWAGAAKLPPATVLVVEDGTLEPHRYWRLAPSYPSSATPSLDEAAEQVDAALGRAVGRRLMSDVPLGALLSGGLDSAAVVAHMAEQGGQVATFTIGFDEADYDETVDAGKVARLFDTDHHTEIVRPEAMSLLDGLIDRYGEPFADASALPTFLVSRLARRHVKVVLTGDGGDESFAGYERYRALALAARLGRPWAAPLRAALALGAGLLPPGGHRSPGTRLRRFSAALSATSRAANHAWRLGLPPGLRHELLTDEGRSRLGEPSFYGADVATPLRLNEALALDVERYLPDDVLVKLDIASMAHGLEARSPFLDSDLMETAAALPGEYKLGGGRSKRVLRRALRRRLPADVLAGPKRGFGVPLDRWFRGPLAGPARDVLLSEDARRRGLFRTERVAALIDDHVGRKVAAHETLFTLLVLERWFQREEHDG